MDVVVITVEGTLILIGIIAYFIVSKFKKEAWEGELVDKHEETSSSGDYDQTYYAVYVKTTEGKNKRVTVKKKLYNELNVGDRLVKVKGETHPKKQQ